MIERLRGQLVEKDPEGLVIDVGGVGYRTAASLATLRALPTVGEECVLHTRMVVREDAMLLFGFATREERAAFDALTAVSRVGPKLAVAMLSALKPAEIVEAVGRNDVVKLASVPGLGKRTAERVILELRGKNLTVFEPGVVYEQNGGGPYMEAREALTALGYSLEESEAALKEIPPQDTVQRYVREALRRIRSGRR
ncbi:MAG TPA: Holliday junction branch migration protein RuvA [Rubrobacteraceae bacterium]|nr:Holliday junction branch migration protein RuvA [Rubrobacteraceae bacterium]